MPRIVVPGAPVFGAGAARRPAPVAIVDDFLPRDLAERMRGDIDAHFANPHRHRPESHQVWNYWYVPGLYTYLRTLPANIFEPDRITAFNQALGHWAFETLGMRSITSPYLSLYVNGCKQEWHNDSGNGRFAYVYSLTRAERRTTGGETLVMREGDGLRGNLLRPAAGPAFFESVPPLFNRLVVFDDRAPHAVARVEGAMDPVEGRFVLHGHISEDQVAAVSGALPAEAVTRPVDAALRAFAEEHAARLPLYHGPLSLRITIGSAGGVELCDVLIDRVVHPNPDDNNWVELREKICERVESLTFPAAAGTTELVLPLLFGATPASLV
jgi:2OG-Fe(II) oxygenase superfamily